MRKANAFSNQTWVCQDQKSSRPKGYFFGDSPLNFPTPILHVQLSISALLTAFFQLILNPLGQTAFISQMLVGIILGPSVLGSGNAFADIVFPLKSFYISETYALFGVMLFVFLVGVKMDISLVKQSGRKAVVIGLSAFFVPLILNIGFALVLRKTHPLPNAELRILACIYQEDSTPSIINLLEVTNPTPQTPICFYVVHLVSLSGRTAPVFITHRLGKRSFRTFQSGDSDRMVNAFRLYEEHSSGGFIMNAFTTISPYATMHDDVCTLALEKRTSMVLIPFHKQFNSLSCMEELSKRIRSVNRNILRNSPCSVGILLDRGTLNTNASLSCKIVYSIGIIFVEGPDDREALAYAMRMTEHPNVSLTVVRLVDNRKFNVHKEHDSELLSKCKIAIAGRKQHVYKEERVKDSVDMINVIRPMQNFYDLIVVGRRHDCDSPLFMGLKEWNEFPELGFIGDMLASSDSNCEVSVLVVQ
ncbi:hypothetical protein ACFX13_029805 [Malus domestica]